MQSEIGRQEKKLMVGGIGLSQEEAEVLAFLRRVEQKAAKHSRRKVS